MGAGEPIHGRRSRGRPQLTHVDILLSDADVDNTKELRALMNDRMLWKQTIDSRTQQPP